MAGNAGQLKKYFGYATMAEFKKDWEQLTPEDKQELKDLIADVDPKEYI